MYIYEPYASVTGSSSSDPSVLLGRFWCLRGWSSCRSCVHRLPGWICLRGWRQEGAETWMEKYGQSEQVWEASVTSELILVPVGTETNSCKRAAHHKQPGVALPHAHATRGHGWRRRRLSQEPPADRGPSSACARVSTCHRGRRCHAFTPRRSGGRGGRARADAFLALL